MGVWMLHYIMCQYVDGVDHLKKKKKKRVSGLAGPSEKMFRNQMQEKKKRLWQQW